MRRVVLILALGSLALSILGNVLLYRTAVRFYRQEAAVRLHPIHNGAPTSSGNSQGRKVLLLGDSRCYQWPANFPAVWNFTNAGVGNETTEQIRLRTHAIIETCQPEVTIIEAGINDLKTLPLFPEQKRQIIDDCFNQIVSLVEENRRSGAAVVVLSLWPAGHVEWSRRLLWSEDIAAAVTEVNQRLARRFAQQAHVQFLDLTDQIRREEDYLDTLHFKPSFYDRVTPFVTSAVELASR